MANHTSTDPRRRALLAGAAGVALLACAGTARARPPVQAEVWKDPNCGCCKEWVAHLKANGFSVKVNDTGNEAVRARLGIAPKYGSCHTALIAGYAIEGHVPARDIHRLLLRKPAALGLAVPGMPVGSPGMDGSLYRGRQDAYEVMLLARNGSATVFSKYEGNKQGRKA